MNSALRVGVKLLREGARVPRRMSACAAGADLFACPEGEVIIEPGDFASVPTGIALAIPRGFEGQVRPRSGLAARRGITVLNSPGTVDSDYRGEVKVLLINHGTEPFAVSAGDRIAQLVIARAISAEFEESTELPESERGEGGFGSTGL